MLVDTEHQEAEAMLQFDTVLSMCQDIKKTMSSEPSKLDEYGSLCGAKRRRR